MFKRIASAVAVFAAGSTIQVATPTAFAAPLGSCSIGSYVETTIGSDSLGSFVALSGADSTGCTWTVPNGVSSVRVLVVAGGGGGGGYLTSGGGGGGGVIHEIGASVTPGSSINVVVGKGGSAGSNAWNLPGNYNNGTNGSNSRFDSLVAIGGGGGGGGGTNSQIGNPGSAGGSGGGGGRCWVGCNTSFTSSNGNKRLGGAGTMNQGNAGGNAPYMSGGGGGGAGSAGSASAGVVAGNGGDGISVEIDGSSTYFAGGGGGGSEGTATRATGGLGGGGLGAANGNSNGSDATPNTGGGGGGTRDGIAGAGAAGTVMIRWGSAPSAPNISLSAPSGFGVINSSVGALYSIANSGSPVTSYSISPSLPTGLTFSSSTGLISGTPTALSSTTTYVVTARRINTTNGASSSSSDSFSFGVFSSTPSTTTTSTTTTTTTTVVAPPTPTTTTTSTTTTTTTVVAPPTTVVGPESTVSTQPQGQASVATISPSVGPTTTVLAPLRLETQQAPQTATTTIPPVVKNAPLFPTVVAPVAPAVAPGGAGATVNGEAIAASLSRVNNQITAVAGDVTSTVSGLTSDGQRVALNSDGNLVVNEGDKLVVNASGYSPGADVSVWLYSIPTRLGVIAADSGGKVSGAFDLPSDLEIGDHRLVLSGDNPDGAEVLVGIGLSYGSLSSGSSLTRVLIAIPIALAILFGLFLPAVTRRRKKNALA